MAKQKIFFWEETEFLHGAPRVVVALLCGKDKMKEDIENGYITDVFNDNPDYIRTKGVTTAFVVVKHVTKRGKTLHVVSSSELTDDEQNAITLLLGEWDIHPPKGLFDAPNTWDWFYAADNAIAYRGGSGYHYGIWGIGEMEVVAV
jgi:hypothetical protein